MTHLTSRQWFVCMLGLWAVFAVAWFVLDGLPQVLVLACMTLGFAAVAVEAVAEPAPQDGSPAMSEPLTDLERCGALHPHRDVLCDEVNGHPELHSGADIDGVWVWNDWVTSSE